MSVILEKLSQALIKLAILLGFPPEPKVDVIVPDEAVPPPAPTVPPHVSKLPLWADGIQQAEGWYKGSASFRNLNPGNLKYTEYTKSLGAVGQSSAGFASFPTYEEGRQALIQFLTDACTNKLKAFKGTMTLEQFTQVYAQPMSLKNYCSTVRSHIKVAFNQISELL